VWGGDGVCGRFCRCGVGHACYGRLGRAGFTGESDVAGDSCWDVRVAVVWSWALGRGGRVGDGEWRYLRLGKVDKRMGDILSQLAGARRSGGWLGGVFCPLSGDRRCWCVGLWFVLKGVDYVGDELVVGRSGWVGAVVSNALAILDGLWRSALWGVWPLVRGLRVFWVSWRLIRR